ncbi:MAG: 3-oxoacyl-[acyl-carrier-protein] synthase III C-terminal domain-containing protein [Polyangiales bacterium]
MSRYESCTVVIVPNNAVPTAADLHPTICGTAQAFPAHTYGQHELAKIACAMLPGLAEPAAIERFFRRVGVSQRHLALPAERYTQLRGFGDRNDAWIATAIPLGQQALERALDDAGVHASEVSALFTTTVTGIAVPSLDARLMNRLPLPASLKRVPMFGLGCLAGAAGVARVADYLRAYPDQVAVLLSVELCSLTVQRDDVSVANLISTGLFGDGAAAVVLAGAKHPLARKKRPLVRDSLAHFFRDTERTMGWDVVDGGFKVVLDRDVPAIAREGLPGLVDGLLGRNGLVRNDVTAWVVHPGGPAVMQATIDGLGLPQSALAETARALAEVGNLSSASVLCLLDDFRKRVRPAPGSHGLLIAMGPAFSAEAVLLQW